MNDRRQHTCIAIDPGTHESAIVVFDSPERIVRAERLSNCELETYLRINMHYENRGEGFSHLAIEMVACYGMPVGEEVFETCVWIGRFLAAFDGPHTKLKRNEIKMHLCHRIQGVNDSVMRQRLIDIYGGKEKAIGKKKSPGPLHGIHGDCWQALAVAVVWWEKNQGAEAVA